MKLSARAYIRLTWMVESTLRMSTNPSRSMVCAVGLDWAWAVRAVVQRAQNIQSIVLMSVIGIRGAKLRNLGQGWKLLHCFLETVLNLSGRIGAGLFCFPFHRMTARRTTRLSSIGMGF